MYRLDQAGLTERERKLVAAAISTFQDRAASRRYSAAQLDGLIRAVLTGQPVDASLYVALMICVDTMLRLLRGSEKHRESFAVLESALDKLVKHPPA